MKRVFCISSFLIFLISSHAANGENNLAQKLSDSLLNVIMVHLAPENRYDQSLIRDSLISSDKAFGYSMSGDIEGTFNYILPELTANPVNINAINAWGICLINDDKPKLSIKFFELVLQLFEDDHTARYNLAYACELSKYYDRAIAGYTYLIDKYPGSAINYYNRARVYNYLDSTNLAVKDYTNAVRLGSLKNSDTDSARICFDIGKIYEKSTNYGNAIKYYTLAIHEDSTLVEAIGRRGNIFYRINDFDSALIDFNRVIDLKGPAINPGIYTMRGYIYIINQKFDLALKDLDASIRLNPNDYAPYNLRGTLLFQMKQFNKACLDLEKAKELGYASNDLTDKYCKLK